MHENVPERPENTEIVCKISKIRLKEVIVHRFLFKNQSFAKVVENFAQTCICVSAAFRNSVCTHHGGFGGGVAISHLRNILGPGSELWSLAENWLLSSSVRDP